MEDSQVRELEGLLAQALDNIVLRPGPVTVTPPAMGLAGYRELLQRCRRFHDPDGRLLLANLTPTVDEPAIRGGLLEIIRHELSDHIEDDRVHSGTCVIGGWGVAGNPIEEILRNLLVRAIADDPAAAARAFAECGGAASFTYSHFVLLTSLTLDAPVALLDQAQFIPLPPTPSGLPSFMPTAIRDRGETEMVLSRVVLRVDKAVTPVFHRPDGASPKSHFSVTVASEDHPDLDLGALCQALSLASGCSVRPTMQWDALLDYEIFDLRPDPGVGTTGWGSGSRYVDLLHSPLARRKGTLTEDGLSDARELYSLIVGLDPDMREHLRIPIERWMRSMEQWEMVEEVIELGIALESLYLPGRNSELAFQFALRAAWHLADDPAGRDRLFKVFKQIYDIRSKAVHGEKIKGTVKVDGRPAPRGAAPAGCPPRRGRRRTSPSFRCPRRWRRTRRGDRTPPAP